MSNIAAASAADTVPFKGKPLLCDDCGTVGKDTDVGWRMLYASQSHAAFGFGKLVCPVCAPEEPDDLSVAASGPAWQPATSGAVPSQGEPSAAPVDAAAELAALREQNRQLTEERNAALFAAEMLRMSLRAIACEASHGQGEAWARVAEVCRAPHDELPEPLVAEGKELRCLAIRHGNQLTGVIEAAAKAAGFAWSATANEDVWWDIGLRTPNGVPVTVRLDLGTLPTRPYRGLRPLRVS